MTPRIHPSRQTQLQSEFEQPYFSQIESFLESEKQADHQVYPTTENIFKAFDLTPWDAVKVVILGQDPYHGHGQAMGLSFSVPEGIALPPSLKNIYKELELEGFNPPAFGHLYPKSTSFGAPTEGGQQRSGDLTHRAEQGVLLLNSILTVRTGEPASHSKIGRQTFTDEVIRKISSQKTGIIFMLRGNYAISKKQIIEDARESPSEWGGGLILTGVHPSPLSAHRGWFGCNHFTLCNDYLVSQGENPIIW